ncbi:hypothetical protein GJ496_006114 [Pomphorhynchus laevis]|nr:hypothetical protein GJ496_006114 [Pomphorhynchus laevis]
MPQFLLLGAMFANRVLTIETFRNFVKECPTTVAAQISLLRQLNNCIGQFTNTLSAAPLTLLRICDNLTTTSK